MPTTRGEILAEAVRHLDGPGLVVLAGPPGIGRTTLLRRVTAAFHGPVFSGGGLAMLRAVPGFALSRAVRARLPVHDQALLAEAVRSRVRGGLLALDDLQWTDSVTLATLVPLAAHCRIAVTVRTPHRLDLDALTRTAAAWLTIDALTGDESLAVVRQLAPGLGTDTTARVVSRAGGNPLALEALARHASTGGGARRDPSSTGTGTEPGTGDTRASTAAPAEVPGDSGPTDPLRYALATALADLTRPARTAMAALGLLGRPAPPALLGAGAAELVAAGLVQITGELASPVSPYSAEVAAGLLNATERRALHRHLATLVPPREAARHLAAAGDTD